MKYFYDTEFYEDGERIHLISIGITAEDGRELYLEDYEFDWSVVPDDHWLWHNVKPWLNGCEAHRYEIANAVRAFIVDQSPKEKHELWGYYSSYDHVVLAQLFGRMVDMPEGIPWFTRDLKQELETWAPNELPPAQDGVEHHALADARWNKKVYDWLHSELGKEAG